MLLTTGQTQLNQPAHGWALDYADAAREVLDTLAASLCLAWRFVLSTYHATTPQHLPVIFSALCQAHTRAAAEKGRITARHARQGAAGAEGVEQVADLPAADARHTR